MWQEWQMPRASEGPQEVEKNYPIPQVAQN